MAANRNVEFNAPPYENNNPEFTQGLCPCGVPTIGGQRRCSACLDQESYSRPTFQSPQQSSQQSTSPYGLPQSPSHSLESPSGPFPLPLRSRHPLPSNTNDSPYGGAASASHPHSDRKSSAGSFSRSSSSFFADLEGNASRRSSSTTPDTGSNRMSSISSNSSDRPLHAEYAPMAAGFARLRSKDSRSAATASRGRARPSTDLGAKMFEGAA